MDNCNSCEWKGKTSLFSKLHQFSGTASVEFRLGHCGKSKSSVHLTNKREDFVLLDSISSKTRKPKTLDFDAKYLRNEDHHKKSHEPYPAKKVQLVHVMSRVACNGRNLVAQLLKTFLNNSSLPNLSSLKSHVTGKGDDILPF